MSSRSMNPSAGRQTALTVLILGSGFAALVCAFFMAGPARAAESAAGEGGEKSLVIPGAFQLQASNGYSLMVLGAPPRKGHPGAILLLASRKHEGVVYSAPATVTETSIHANLGVLGEISVTFQPTGKSATARSECGGKKVSFDSGRYEGTIEFHGEEGYTDLVAASAPGNIDFWLNVLCAGVGTGRSGFLPGAELKIRNPGLGPQLSVIKNRPSAPARIEVGVSESREGISIERTASLLMPSGHFTYDSRLRTATLHPPAPFAGTGHFDRRKKAGSRWSGDLTVDLPGRADVPLTGRALRATLVHAEWGFG